MSQQSTPTSLEQASPVQGSAAPLPAATLPAGTLPAGTLNHAEMGDLLQAFNAAATRLQSTHEALTSEVTRLRRELHEANEAVERGRRLAALGEMAAGIAHEVRNPLGGIRLYATMLEEDLAHSPQQQELARKIRGATRAVEAIVGDVLSFAREIRVRTRECDARCVIDGALEHLTHASVAGMASVRIARDVAQEERVRLGCDSALLSQALANIVRNAVEAMHEHASPVREVTIEAQATRLAFGSGKRVGACVLSVIDTGPGIAPEVVPRMFNPFFTTRQHGTGLGLAIVHRIVDAHAGRVSVRNASEFGAALGACVSIVLPMAAEAPTNESDAPQAVVVRGAKTLAGTRRGKQAQPDAPPTGNARAAPTRRRTTSDLQERTQRARSEG
jgi:signal transduction histidine kinase